MRSKLNSEIFWKIIHEALINFIVWDKKTIEERYLEKIFWSVLKFSKQTDTLAEPEVKSFSYSKFYINISLETQLSCWSGVLQFFSIRKLGRTLKFFA